MIAKAISVGSQLVVFIPLHLLAGAPMVSKRVGSTSQ
jgi:hypothetical protein